MDNEFLRRTIVLKERDRLDMVTFSVFTAVCFVLGILAIFELMPLPKSLNESLQPVAHYSWAVLLILGSSFAFVGRLKARLETEAGGCFSLALAFLTYVVAIISNGSPSGFAVAGVFLALVVKYGYRGYALNRLKKEIQGADTRTDS